MGPTRGFFISVAVFRSDFVARLLRLSCNENGLQKAFATPSQENVTPTSSRRQKTL
jgi:hypothetical protein